MDSVEVDSDMYYLKGCADLNTGYVQTPPNSGAGRIRSSVAVGLRVML